MKIGFIGAGKVGFTLGKYFALHGAEVMGYYSHNSQSAREAAEFTATNMYACASDLLAVSDVLFLTVPDDAIAACFDELRREDLEGKIFCHASGAMTADAAFPDIETVGAYGYSVHPLFAVSDKFSAYRELADVFFTLEGSEGRKDFMLKWLRGIGIYVQPIEAEVKAKYHAAAAIVSNQVVALFAEGQQMLQECGFSDEMARMALKPIFMGNAEHVTEDGVVRALTGPVQRGDIGTLQKHISVLAGSEDKLMYILLSKRLVNIAKAKNPAYDDTAMREFLQEQYQNVIRTEAAQV